MSNGFLQLGTVDVLVLTFINFGATAIPAGLAVLVDSANPPTAQQAGGVVLPTASGGVVGSIGVTVETLYPNRPGRVRLAGVSVVQANGTINYGAPVQISDTAGKLGWVKAEVPGTVTIGFALTPAVDGDILPIFHALANNA